MLRCYGCKTDKSLEEYSPSQRKIGNSKHRYCRSCRKTERVITTKKTNPLTRRKWMLSSRYKLTLEQVDQMLKNQDGLCAICPKDISLKYFIDHNHDTGKVRGLLCPGCNSRLPQVEYFLQPSLDYLEKFR